MSAAPVIAGRPPRRHAAPGAGPLSSTTPDTAPSARERLSLPRTLAWGVGLGAAVGVLLLRPAGAGWAAGALARGAGSGAVIGAGMGAALFGIDRLTGGELKRTLDTVLLDRRAQAWFVLRHPTMPWLGPMGLGVARDAREAQESLFGRAEPLDGPQDAFRHGYAAALFALRAMRDHGLLPARAHALAIEAGEAHEVDGQDNNDRHSRAMDEANNLAGTAIVGDGRAQPGEPGDDHGFVTQEALRRRVLDALADGRLTLVDRSGTTPVLRATTRHDLPAHPGR